MTRISIIAAENDKKKRKTIRLKRKQHNKQRKINAYRLQNQHEWRKAFLQMFTETESTKAPKQPVSVIQNKSLFERLCAGLRRLF